MPLYFRDYFTKPRPVPANYVTLQKAVINTTSENGLFFPGKPPITGGDVL